MNRFFVFMKTGVEKWPLEFFETDSVEESSELASLDEIRNVLKEKAGVYYRNSNKDGENERKFLYKSQISSIVGPIFIPGKDDLKLEHVMTLTEAVEKWKNIRQLATIRKAIQAGRFHDWEIRKSEAIWLITHAGMTRMFGPHDVYEYPSMMVNKADIIEGKLKWEGLI